MDPRSHLTLLALLLLLATLLPGCSGNPGETPSPADPQDLTPAQIPDVESTPPDWASVDDFLYQLQRERPEKISETAFDLLVVSIAAAGNSPERIHTLQHSPGGDKLVLCYMSIGQAEDYRFYWQPEWKEEPPSWLDQPDPDWAGDYWVRYWDPAWQQIICGTPESYLDRMIDRGYDGVYLDRVDTYWYYQDQGRETAAQEMVDFVLALADYAREKKPGFGVFPQNAEELGAHFPQYLDAMTGIGVEDLYYGYERDHQASPPEWTAEREAILDRWASAGKLVLTIDYTSVPEQIADAYERSRARGYVPYVADRSLGRLRINPGFEPD